MFSWMKKKQNTENPTSIKRSKSPRLSFSPNVKPLPTHFADEVITLEMKLQSSGDLDTLKQLLELYTVTLT